MSLPRGIRNNNPGNIRWGDNWKGLVSQEKRTDKEFCQFRDSVSGLRALAKVLLTYEKKYGLNTIESIINRYAPPHENNTAGYIQRVCQALAVLPKQPITLTDNVLKELMKVIIGVENGGMYYNHYSIELIERAIKQARD